MGFGLRCGGDRLGLQGAPGALPSALGFESPRKPPKSKTAIPVGMTVSLLANDCYFDKNTHIVQFRNTDILLALQFFAGDVVE